MEHPCDLAERIRDLLFDNNTSDVTLIVEGESLPAHRAILATSSKYFRALLFGNMKESLDDNVALKEVPLRGFKLLMSYLYTGQLKLGEIDVETILEILELAHLYGLETLQLVLCGHLVGILDPENVSTVFSTAHCLQLKDLSESCNRVIIENPLAFLKSAGFCDLPETALLHIISDDTFCAREIEIFEAVSRWCAKHPDGEHRSRVLEEIRLPLIDCKDLVRTVADSGLIARDAIVNAIRTQTCGTASMRYRASISSGVNLASPDHGAYELESNPPEVLFTTANCSIYRKKSLPSYPSTIKVNKTGLIVALRQPFFINHIAFKLPSRSSTSYYVEVSMDLKEWVRVIDHEKYSCESLQKLYFEVRASRFIRIMTTSEADISISSFEVSHVVKPLKLACGFYAPEENVVTKAFGTRLLITATRRMIELVKIKFPQPYVVDSMQMYLSEFKTRRKFYIETSVDCEKWRRVADYTTDICRSCQRITFDAHPVLSIRIRGDDTTTLSGFSRLECPAPVEVRTPSSASKDSTEGNASDAT